MKREEQNPDALVRKTANGIFFAGHAYENRPEGTRDTIAKFDADACRKAVARAATPGRLLVVLVSSLSQDAAKALLEEKLQCVKAPEEGEPARAPLAAASPKERSAFAKKQTATTYIRGEFAAPAPTDPLYPTARVPDLPDRSRRVSLSTDEITAVASTEKWKRIVAGTAAGDTFLLGEGGAALRAKDASRSAVLCAAITADGKTAVTGHTNGAVRIHTSASTECVSVLDSPVTAIAIDDERIIVATRARLACWMRRTHRWDWRHSFG